MNIIEDVKALSSKAPDHTDMNASGTDAAFMTIDVALDNLMDAQESGDEQLTIHALMALAFGSFQFANAAGFDVELAWLEIVNHRRAYTEHLARTGQELPAQPNFSACIRRAARGAHAAH
jgi:hypothetical protein